MQIENKDDDDNDNDDHDDDEEESWSPARLTCAYSILVSGT